MSTDLNTSVEVTSDARGGELPDEAFAVALASLDAMTTARLRALLHGRSAQAAFEVIVEGRLPAELARSHERDPSLCTRWSSAARRCDVSELWQRCRDGGIDVYVHGHIGYPDALVDDPAAPPVLFVRGDLSALQRRRVGIVGTRNATPGGLRAARGLGETLAGHDVAVVSGLARGIDGAAHRGVRAAIERSVAAPPVAVVGSGLDVVFPREHRDLWDWVGDHGVLLSEYPPGTEPLPTHFPARNRILAALSEVLVVVESRDVGGSLITVREAMKRNITVMAVPGSVLHRASRGTNQLISEGAAAVLESADVLVALGLDTRRSGGLPFDPRREPTTADRAVLASFGVDTLAVDEVVARCGLGVIDTALAIGRLESEGWLVDIGGWYEPANSPQRWT